MLFELTNGFPPFYATDPTKTARNIIKGKFNCPDDFSNSLCDIITKLLCDQSKRLGRTQGGAAEVMKHQWFAGFDWDALLGKTMETPSKPDVSDDLESLGRKDYGASNAPDSSWTPSFD